MKKDSKKMTNKAGGILKKIALVFLCIILFILLLLGAITTFVSSDLAKNEVEQLAKNYVNGDVKIGDIDFDFYSSFPYLSLQLDSVDIRSNAVSIPSDSLCFVERLRVRLGFNSLLIGRFSIKEVLLENPKIILRKDSLSQYNFDILPKDTTEQDSSSNTIDLPYVKLKELNLKNASIVYEDLSKKQRAQLDGLNIFGDAFCTDEIGATVDFEIKNITCSDQKYTFNNIPFSAKADIVGEKDFSKFSVKKLDVNLNDVKASVNGEVELDSTEIQTDLAWFFGVEDMMILKEFLPSPLDQKLKKLMLDGSVAVDGTIKGTFAEKQLPAIAANLNLNQLTLYFKGYKGRLSFDLHADGLYDENKNANSYLKLKNADLIAGQSFIKIDGKVLNAVHNPQLQAHVAMAVNLDTISASFPIYEDLNYKGKFDGDVSLHVPIKEFLAKKSESLEKIYLYGDLNIHRIMATMPSKNWKIFGNNANIEMGINSIKYKRVDLTSFFTTKLTFDSLFVDYGEMDARADFSKLSGTLTVDKILESMPLFRASLEYNGMKAFLADTIALVGKKGNTSLSLFKDRKDSKIPCLTARVGLDSLMFYERSFGAMVDSVRFSLSGKPRVRKFRRENGIRVQIEDSLRQEIRYDSLSRMVSSVFKQEEPMDHLLRKFTFDGKAYMKELRYSSPYFPTQVRGGFLDMKFTDDTIRLNSVGMKVGQSSLFVKGELQNVRRALLRGRTLTADLSVKSQQLNLNEILNTMYRGSQFQERAEKMKLAQQQGLIPQRKSSGKRLIRPQIFKPDYFLRMQALMSTNKARKAKMDSLLALVDKGLVKSEDIQTLDVAEDSISSFGLLCLPQNLNVNFDAKIDTVKFSNLVMNQFNGGITLKNQVLQINDLKTQTNIGDLNLNARYYCNNNNGASLGFDVQGDGIDVGNLVNTLPMLDTIMPMLRSFKGNVSCDISAMTEVDSMMNILFPTLNAACYIKGDNLVLLDGETFAEIAKLLMFKKKTENLIDNISVEAYVKNNEMEVLPFMIELDKYRVAVGGENTLDFKFNYHISVLKSPLPMKLGINVKGSFDDIKVGLGKVKYKDENVITKKGQFANGGVNLRTVLQEELKRKIVSITQATEESKRRKK